MQRQFSKCTPVMIKHTFNHVLGWPSFLTLLVIKLGFYVELNVRILSNRSELAERDSTTEQTNFLTDS